MLAKKKYEILNVKSNMTQYILRMEERAGQMRRSGWVIELSELYLV